MSEQVMKTAWFSFGQSHVHRVNGKTFDCDCLVKITSPDPRQAMFDSFGDKWAMQYDRERMTKALHYYHRGVIEL